jgi:two-component system chemotaxis sensor kinase CheA
MNRVDDAFVRESTSRARELSNGLISIERDPDDRETLDEAFRVAHTLKGNCGAAGLERASELAHAVEDVLDAIRRGSLDPSGEIVDDALAAVDDLEDVVKAAGRGERAAVDVETRTTALREPIDESLLETEATDDDEGSGADPGEEIEFPEIPTEGQDLSPEEALDRASVFDDIDQLMEEMDDDAEEFADLGNAGTFDQLDEAPDEEPSRTLDQSGNVGSVFDEIKSEVGQEEANVDTLQSEIEEVEFGEFDDDDDVTIQELIEGDVGDETLDDDTADEPAVGDEEPLAADAAGSGDAGVPPGDDEPSIADLVDVEPGDGEESVEAESPSAVPEPRGLGADAEPAIVDAPPAPRPLDSDADPAVSRSLDDDAEPAVRPAAAADPEASSPAPRTLDPAATPAVERGPSAEPRSLAPAATPAVERGPSAEPRSLAPDVEPAITAADGAPTARSLDPDAEPAITATEESAGSDAADVAETAAVGPRPLADDLTPAVTGSGDATVRDVVAAVEELAAEEQDLPESPASPEGPEPSTADADRPATDASPGETPATAGSSDVEATGSPVSASEPEPEPEPAADAVEAGSEPDDDGFGEVDDSGFQWASGFDESDDEGTVEPAAASADAGIDATDDDPDTEFPDLESDPATADVDAVEGFEASDGPAADESGEAPDIDELDDIDLELDTDLDEDLGFGGDESDEAAGGPDLDADPDLDLDLDLDLEFDDVGAGLGTAADDAGFDVEFVDEETAEFESRFSTAFDEAGDVAAAEAAAAVRSSMTIEGSDLDGDVYGDGSLADRLATDERTSDVQTLTVDVENADELLTLAETLTVTRLQLEGAVAPDNEAAEEALSSLQSVASDFRRTVMDIRLMPLRTAVDTLPRVVRDVARREGKDVDFRTEGTEVRLDRSVIDRIGDPLVHLVRNAVDHGIESPAVREEKGKDPTGTIELRAEQQRDNVVIEVTDDGAGIDADAVRARAVEDGLLSFEEAEALADEEVHELLFRSGFSTVEEVTEVSGRGVGMNVVDRVLTELDGSVQITSDVNEGTTVRLTLPVTVAMAEVWLVESGSERFAVPAGPVEQIEGPGGADRVGDREVFRSGAVGLADGGTFGAGSGGPGDGGADADPTDDAVPLVRLRDAFGTDGERTDGGMILRLREGVRPLAIHCDRVIDRQEVVVKPYGELLGGVPGLSGATLRGDGRLVNVVDVDSLDAQ